MTNFAKGSKRHGIRYLITGSSSVIGKSLTEKLLSDGHEVVAYDVEENLMVHEDLEIFQGDVRDTKSLTEASRGCEAGIHLAVLAGGSKAEDLLSVNVIGTHSFFTSAVENHFGFQYSRVQRQYTSNQANLINTAGGNDVYDLSTNKSGTPRIYG